MHVVRQWAKSTAAKESTSSLGPCAALLVAAPKVVETG